MHRPSHRLAALVALAFGALAPAAHAGPDQFGFGPRGIAMGGAFTALSTDWSATYYNMAGLAFAEASELSLGYTYAGYELDYDAEAFSDTQNRRVERQQPMSAVTLGLASRFGDEGWLGRIGAGLGVLFPTRQLAGFEAESAPGSPVYYLYGGRRDKIGVLPAAAIRILPWDTDDPDAMALSFGVGLTILADLQGEVVFDASASAVAAARTAFKIEYDLAPNFGILFWPVPWFSLGIAYRGEISLKVDFDIVVDLDGDGISEFPLGFEAVTLFQPQQVQVGFAVDPIDSVTLAFDVTWLNWSRFRDPFVTIEPILAQIDPDAKDTFVPRVGVMWRASRAVTLRTGYYYQTSPFPEQVGATNLVDPDKHVFALGGSYTFWHERERLTRTENGIEQVKEGWDLFTIDAFFQLHMLERTRVQKNDPAASGGVGERYEAGGLIWNAGIFGTFRF